MRRYGRLETADEAGGGPAGVDEPRRSRAELIDRVTTKIHAAFWVAMAAITLVYGDVLRAAIDPGRSNP